jgi:hypothetical protein
VRGPATDPAFIRDILKTGALLEKQTFWVAESIVRAFIAQQGMGPEDWLALNGLPRHAAQAAEPRGQRSPAR